MLQWCISKPNLSQLFIIMVTNNNNNNKIYLCFWQILESFGNLLAHAILTKCNQCAIDGWWWKNQAKAKGKWLWLTFTQWSIRLITNKLYQSDTCMTDSNRGWRCLTDGWSTWVCFPQTLASFPLQLYCKYRSTFKGRCPRSLLGFGTDKDPVFPD